MATKTEIMKFLMDHFINYDEDISTTDLWVIIDVLIDFLKTEPDQDRVYRVMNNIKALIKGVIFSEIP